MTNLFKKKKKTVSFSFTAFLKLHMLLVPVHQGVDLGTHVGSTWVDLGASWGHLERPRAAWVSFLAR
jgi:hypothetical protein